MCLKKSTKERENKRDRDEEREKEGESKGEGHKEKQSFCLPLCDSEKEKVREAYCVRRNTEQRDVERHKS